MPQQHPGLFGKIPGHGDFIDRNLQRSFISIWDDWLQRCVACSQEQLSSAWLDIYLTSPIWRFALSPGAIDNHCWVGILVPSVDSVGRYFPLTIAQPIYNEVNLFDFHVKNDLWFSRLEEAALSSLQNYLDADTLAQSIQLPENLMVACPAVKPTVSLRSGYSITSASTAAAYPQLLHQLIASQNESYSLWWNNGSERMKPALLQVKGLPEAKHYAALLDGNWPHWENDL